MTSFIFATLLLSSQIGPADAGFFTSPCNKAHLADLENKIAQSRDKLWRDALFNIKINDIPAAVILTTGGDQVDMLVIYVHNLRSDSTCQNWQIVSLLPEAERMVSLAELNVKEYDKTVVTVAGSSPDDYVTISSRVPNLTDLLFALRMQMVGRFSQVIEK